MSLARVLVDVVLMDLKMPAWAHRRHQSHCGRNPTSGSSCDDVRGRRVGVRGAEGWGQGLRPERRRPRDAATRGQGVARERSCSAPIAHRALEQFGGPTTSRRDQSASCVFDELTPRELEVLRLVAQV